MNELLNKLNKSLSAKEETKKEEIRNTILLDSENWQKFAAANEIMKIAEARKVAEETILYCSLMEKWIEKLWETGVRPENPYVQSNLEDGKPDIRGLFQVHSRYTFNLLPGNEPKSEKFEKTLISIGLTKKTANDIVKNEVDVVKETTLRPFNELINGRYEGKTFVEATDEEQKVANKILKFVMEELTQKERELALKTTETVKIKDGFLQRLKKYTKTPKQATEILKVIKPVAFVNQIKYGLADSPEEKVKRLSEDAINIITGE